MAIQAKRDDINPKVFAIVKSVIDENDYEDLLALGAPSCEYDLESSMITQMIRPEMDEFQIADVIAQVFKDMFGCPDNPYTGDEFYHAAEMILNELSGIPLDEKKS